MPQHQGVEEAPQGRQVLLLGGDAEAELVEIPPDQAGGDLRAAPPPARRPGPVDPGEELAHGVDVGPPRVRVADLAGEEFLPDERRGRPGRRPPGQAEPGHRPGRRLWQVNWRCSLGLPKTQGRVDEDGMPRYRVGCTRILVTKISASGMPPMG